MSRVPLTAALIVLLVLGGLTIVSTLRGTPAFNGALQEDSVFGTSRVGSVWNRYDLAEYLKVIGVTFLEAQLMPPGIPLIDGESGPGTIEITARRAARSVSLLKHSIALAPGDADSWRWLAWGLAMTGDAEGARSALSQSWALAPYHRQLALLRLELVPVLYGDQQYDPEIASPRRPSPEERTAVLRDLDTLRILDPQDFRAIADSIPAIFQQDQS